MSLSHDHHHALVAARRLGRAASLDADPAPAVASFVSFFETESSVHFREEEEHVFPLVASVGEAQPLVVRALLDHQSLRALVRRLESSDDARPVMAEIAERLEAHVRLEERELFPLIERIAAAELERAPIDVRTGGPVWDWRRTI